MDNGICVICGHACHCSHGGSCCIEDCHCGNCEHEIKSEID